MTKTFAEGIYFKKREGSPDFVIGSLSVKSEVFKQFLEQHTNEKGYVDLDIKKSKNEGFYVELNTWSPPGKEEEKPKEDVIASATRTEPAVDYPEEEINPEDIPF